MEGKWGKWNKEGEAINQYELSSQFHMGGWDGRLWGNSAEENVLTRGVKALKNLCSDSRQSLRRAAVAECQSPGPSACHVRTGRVVTPGFGNNIRFCWSRWGGGAHLRGKRRAPVTASAWARTPHRKLQYSPSSNRLKDNPLPQGQTWTLNRKIFLPRDSKLTLTE